MIPRSQTIALRQWREEDVPLFAEMCADPVVTEFFPRMLSAAESEAFVTRHQAKIEKDGWGLWAVDVDGRFAGFTGLAVPSFQASFMPCVEIGWRLRREFWGTGVALNAARQAEAYGFGVLGLRRLVSFTSKTNVRSWRLMEKLGFYRVQDGEFLHPSIDPRSPLCLHLLYAKDNPACSASA